MRMACWPSARRFFRRAVPSKKLPRKQKRPRCGHSEVALSDLESPIMFEQQFVNALSLGCVYALFALGFTLIFGVLGVINLAHGAVFMVGAYAALVVVQQFSLPCGRR